MALQRAHKALLARRGRAYYRTDVSGARGRVVIYSAPFCPFCVRAKRLLDARGIAYQEVDVAADPALRAEMIAASRRRTVPQIFIDGTPIGGFEELVALDRRGALAALATSAP